MFARTSTRGDKSRPLQEAPTPKRCAQRRRAPREGRATGRDNAVDGGDTVDDIVRHGRDASRSRSSSARITPAPDDSRLPVKALTAHRVPARWKTSRRPGRGVARAKGSFAAIVSRTYSLESSLISIFFWHPVAGLAMLNCGGWGVRASAKIFAAMEADKTSRSRETDAGRACGGRAGARARETGDNGGDAHLHDARVRPLARRRSRSLC